MTNAYLAENFTAMSKTIRQILLGALVVLVAIQFIRPSQQTPTPDPSIDFLQLANPPANIVSTLKAACYDCHSYETQYPWYANVAPVSWWISNHIREGRQHLNFSEWGKYNLEKQAHKAEETAEEVAEGHMPLKTYPPMHPEARLTQEQRDQIAAYFEALEVELKSIPPMPSASPN